MTGTTLRIRFQVLESALINQSKASKHQSAKNDGTIDDTMALRIIDEIRRTPKITFDQLSEQVGIARRTLVRYKEVDIMDVGRSMRMVEIRLCPRQIHG